MINRNQKINRNQIMIQSARRKEKENCDPHWDKENQMLKTQAQANSRLRQQITKESYADNVVQHSINNRIIELKDSAMKLAKCLEGEKRKNQQLEAIIRHMNFIMNEQKKKEAIFRDDLNYESVDNLSRKIKKMEYDLDQVNSKSNNLSSKNKVKKNEIDAYRTQRVIDSSIFLKIEKELIDSEMKFKKLLIQKIKREKQYQKSLNNYVKMKNDIGKEKVEFNQTQEKQEDQFFINAPEINHAAKFTDVEYMESKKRRFSVNSKRMNSVHEVKKQKSFEEEFSIKKLFMETGLSSSASVIYHLENIEEINQNLYRYLNQKSDEGTQLKIKIGKIQKLKDKKKIHYYQGEPKLTKAELQYFRAKQLEKYIEQEELQTVSEQLHVNKFLSSKELISLEKFVGTPVKAELDDQDNLSVLCERFRSLQSKIGPMLSSGQEQNEEATLTLGKEDNIEEIISKIKRIEESEKVMTREDFQDEYEKMKKTQSKLIKQKKKQTF